MAAGARSISPVREVADGIAGGAGGNVVDAFRGDSGFTELKTRRGDEVEVPFFLLETHGFGGEAARDLAADAITAGSYRGSDVDRHGARVGVAFGAQDRERANGHAGLGTSPARVHGGDHAGSLEQEGSAIGSRDREAHARHARHEGIASLVKPWGGHARDVVAVHLAGGGERCGRESEGLHEPAPVLGDVARIVAGRTAEIEGVVGRVADAAEARRERQSRRAREVEAPRGNRGTRIESPHDGSQARKPPRGGQGVAPHG